MPEDLKVSQTGSSLLPPPFRGLHSPRVRKHCQIILACYFRKSSIIMLTTCVSKLHQQRFMLKNKTITTTKPSYLQLPNNHIYICLRIHVQNHTYHSGLTVKITRHTCTYILHMGNVFQWQQQKNPQVKRKTVTFREVALKNPCPLGPRQRNRYKIMCR